MTDGRTSWWAKDSAWWRRERVVQLGERFGSDGPAVLDWLACEADSQRDSGHVKAGYLTLARGCFIASLEKAREIVRFAAQIGALDDFQEHEPTFTCRVSGWRLDQERARNAARQAAYRERMNRGGKPATV